MDGRVSTDELHVLSAQFLYIWRSEIFGPVLPVIEVEDVDEAIQIVSDRYVSALTSNLPLLNLLIQTNTFSHLRFHQQGPVQR